MIAIVFTCAAFTAAPPQDLGARLDALPLSRPDATTVPMSKLRPGRPVALIVTKGNWCRVCSGQLRRAHDNAKRIKPWGEVFGLSSNDVASNTALMQQLGLGFDVLSADKKLFELLEMWLYTDDHPWPGLIFLDACGKVAGRFVGRRPGTGQLDLIIEILKEIGRQPSPCGVMT